MNEDNQAEHLLIRDVPLTRAEELMDELTPQAGKYLTDTSGWLFRGQRNANWGLVPGAQRDDALGKYGYLGSLPLNPMTKAEREAMLEFQLINHYASLADAHGFHLPGDTPEFREAESPIAPEQFPPVRWRGIAALAQHYGVPTRLLDWTVRPLVGAYFACVQASELSNETQLGKVVAEDASACFALWALSSLFIETQLASRDPGVSVISAPSALIPNLKAQGGTFTLVRFQNEDIAKQTRLPNLDEVVRSIKPQSGMVAALIKFTLPVTESGRLLRMLSRLDVTAASIYPGLQSVERLMHERTLYRP